MRGQDIVIWVLLSLWKGSVKGRLDYLSKNTGLSKREIQNSFNRLAESKLFDPHSNHINIKMFLHFLKEGIRYFAPITLNLNRKVVGIPTIYPSMNEEILSDGIQPVWKSKDGSELGIEVTPLHKSCLILANSNRRAYQLMCLIDAARSWLPREREYALEKIEEIFL